jgi:thiamine-phosphate pyrophosphorylase
VNGLVVVTDRIQAAARGRTLAEVVAAAVEGGARTVLLREKDLPAAGRRALADDLADLLRPVDGELLVAGDVQLATAVGAIGVHLAAADPPAAASDLVVGRSCHSIGELRAALARAEGYATFSPVWTTASKPGYGPAVGIEGLADACAAVPDLPIVALGGITLERAPVCVTAGAAAVAMMGEVMRADDPAGLVGDVLAALAAAGSVAAPRRGARKAS